MGLKLILRNLKPIFSENLVSVSGQNLSDCKFADFKVDEGFKTLRFLNDKAGIGSEAVADNMREFV